jgi:hypothetical protein
LVTVVRRIYCVDTSSFAYCQRSFGQRSTRLTFFAPVWDLLDRLADEERLVAPYLAHIEITRNNDEIGRWAEAHPAVFRPKGEHAARVLEILKEPGQRLVDPTAPRGAEEADPWVIALAEAVSATSPTLFDARPLGVVVSEEARAGGIADICRRRGLEHLDFTEMLTAEGLGFRPTAAT